jgi:chemotaxis methyl-accepting protein methylase
MEVLSVFYKSASSLAKRIPYLAKWKDSLAWKTCRHRIALVIGERKSSHFTGFLRLPSQFEALSGPVLAWLAAGQPGPPLRIVVVGCSNGAEAYTIASVLIARAPGIEFVIDAYDIDGDIIEKARSGCFHVDEVLNNKILTTEFIQATFDADGEKYRVKEDIAARVRFHVADVLNPDFAGQRGLCDILFAQNFLFHLPRRDAIRAFENLCELLGPRAVLFADGMDLGLRQKLTRAKRLVPLDFRIKEIHNEARRARAVGWPDQYWGLEPYLTFSADGRRRYATIFLKGLDDRP